MPLPSSAPRCSARVVPGSRTPTTQPLAMLLLRRWSVSQPPHRPDTQRGARLQVRMDVDLATSPCQVTSVQRFAQVGSSFAVIWQLPFETSNGRLGQAVYLSARANTCRHPRHEHVFIPESEPLLRDTARGSVQVPHGHTFAGIWCELWRLICSDKHTLCCRPLVLTPAFWSCDALNIAAPSRVRSVSAR